MQCDKMRLHSAVDSESLAEIIALHSNPHQECPVGSTIQHLLKSPYSRIEYAMSEAMKKNLICLFAFCFCG